MTNHRVLFREWCNLPLNQHIRIIKNGEQAPDNKMYFAKKTALPIPIKANIEMERCFTPDFEYPGYEEQLGLPGEYFKGDAEIMIATEAGAEGVNLQFCSLVINYDLPWNPQRIEQRIGRCHRYGQKHDVVVINFVNHQNEAGLNLIITTHVNGPLCMY